MSKLIRILILLILPVVFLLSCEYYKNSKGEFFLNSQYDPSSQYLINSLNLSQSIGNGIRLYEHPGTNVIVTGSVIIYLLHLAGPANEDIVTDVFKRPEFYLYNMYLVFLFLNFSALFILGIVAYRSLGKANSAVILQLTPFISVTAYFWITNVSPEPFLMFSVLLLISAVISYTSKESLSTKTIIKYIILFGLICGFGLAAKISFFPLLIIPLILIKRISFKVLFCFITGIFFLLFIIPVLSGEYSYQFIKWLKNMMTHSGKYGTGENTFFNTDEFFKNLKTIFTNEPVFIYSYLLLSLTFLIQFFPVFKQKIRSNKYSGLLTGIFLAMTIQIIIVCKHFELHYLIPAYLLIVLGLYVVNTITSDLFPNLFKRSKLIYLYIIMIIIFSHQIPAFLKSASFYSSRRDASRNFIHHVDENYRQSIVVSSYGASSEEFALYLGALFGGSQKNNYYSKMKNMFPKNYYYDKWSKNLINVTDSVTLKNNLLSSGRFVFLCDNETTLKDFMIIVKDLTGKQDAVFKKAFSNSNGEAVYEIDLESN